MTSFIICTGSWNELLHDAKLIREQVFIQEQNIPAADEWDTQDAISRHFVVFDQAQPVATARLLQNNSIGRVAVLKAYRRQGIGKLLMLEIIQQAKHEQSKFLKLSSQVHAVQFYTGLGFTVEGVQYLDCGIAHIDMYLKLQ